MFECFWKIANLFVYSMSIWIYSHISEAHLHYIVMSCDAFKGSEIYLITQKSFTSCFETVDYKFPKTIFQQEINPNSNQIALQSTLIKSV